MALIWLGFAATSNRGSGLGKNFANALARNLNQVFTGFEDKVAIVTAPNHGIGAATARALAAQALSQ